MASDPGVSDPEAARDYAYRLVTGVSLAVTVASTVILTLYIPLLHDFSSNIGSQLETDAVICERTSEELTFMLRDFGFFDSINATRKKRDEVDEWLKSTGQQECKCEYPRGRPGLRGRDGLRGEPGPLGIPGRPARLPCDPPIDFKLMCPDPCPRGPQGPPGIRGLKGETGPRGVSGKDGIRGKDGDIGPKGQMGARGIPGLMGEMGESGEDAVPQPFIPGPPGERGEEGPPGIQGPVGMPGIDGPQGSQGPRGRKGKDGISGDKGERGFQGAMGEQGDEGSKGVCPTYCANDGGVFFVQPPDWMLQQ